MRKPILSTILYTTAFFFLSCAEDLQTATGTNPSDPINCYSSVSPYIADYKLDRYESEVLNLERIDLTKKTANYENAVLFYGSSSITIWNPDLPADFPNFPVIAHGFGGSTYPELIFYKDRLATKFKNKSIVLYCENDIFNGSIPKTNEQVVADACYLVNELHTFSPKAKIFILSMKHSPARFKSINRFNAINQLLKEYSKTKSYLGFIDINPAMYKSDQKTLDGSIFKSDSLHMNRTGYERWISIIKPILEADYKSR